MRRRSKQESCVTCNQPIFKSYDLDDNDEMVEYKSHVYFGDEDDKQMKASLLDQHHNPMTKQELKAAQKRVKAISPNHPSLAAASGPKETLPDNVISLEQFRDRKRTQ